MDKVMSCCFSFDGKLLASSSLDKTIILWNVETRTCIKIINDSTSVCFVVFDNFGRCIVVHFLLPMSSLCRVERIMM